MKKYLELEKQLNSLGDEDLMCIYNGRHLLGNYTQERIINEVITRKLIIRREKIRVYIGDFIVSLVNSITTFAKETV